MIINNIFCFLLGDLQTDIDKKQKNSLFQPIRGNHLVQSFLTKKRKGPENKIIINDEKLDNQKLDIIIDNKNINFENKILFADTKDTNSEKSNRENVNKGQSIFKVKIEMTKNNKKGRKTISSKIKAIHTKFSYDNILRKIKVKFFKKLIHCINNIILLKYRSKIKTLVPLEGKISQNNGINFNSELLNLKIKDLFLNFGISRKFKNSKNDNNKEVIKKIYEENLTEIIELLEMTFLEVFSIFRASKKGKNLFGLESLDQVIEEIKNKEKDDEYIDMFRNIAMNYEKYYIKK